MWRARCLANRHAGFGKRSEETGRPKGRNRASGRLHLILGVATIPVPLLSAHDIATGLSLAPMHVVAGAAWFSVMMLGAKKTS